MRRENEKKNSNGNEPTNNSQINVKCVLATQLEPLPYIRIYVWRWARESFQLCELEMTSEDLNSAANVVDIENGT